MSSKSQSSPKPDGSSGNGIVLIASWISPIVTRLSPDGSTFCVTVFPTYRYRFASPAANPMGSSLIHRANPSREPPVQVISCNLIYNLHTLYTVRSDGQLCWSRTDPQADGNCRLACSWMLFCGNGGCGGVKVDPANPSFSYIGGIAEIVEQVTSHPYRLTPTHLGRVQGFCSGKGRLHAGSLEDHRA